MIIALAFWTLVLLSCGFAFLFGGVDGRRISIVYVAACLATLGALLVQADWSRTHWPTFAVDMVLLFLLWRIALRSRRWFATWFTGLHLVAVVSHAASMVVSSYAFKLYFFLQGFWSVPMLLTLVIGVELDRRAGLGDDPAQS
ncbi:MAG: hypothetical protein EON59_02710 [Alphaproteobacteria bacterium]|nr:MAG: hypothetical protein EON59_02710 [Alphaproteobacteria bacterium]